MKVLGDSHLRQLAFRGAKLHGIRVVDGHGHIGDWVRLQMFGQHAADMVEVMDHTGVDAVCISAFLSLTADCHMGNDIVADAIRRFPGRFIGYAAINPNYPEDVMPELERCMDKLGMQALKFHPDLHKYPADGPSYMQALEFADDRGCLVLSHTWGTADILRGYAERYPNVKFSVGHCAFHIPGNASANGWPSGDSWIDVIREAPNVYADTALSIAPLGGFEALVAAVGSKKILFGSDFPLHDVNAQLGRVLFAEITDEEKMDILGRNIDGLLK